MSRFDASVFALALATLLLGCASRERAETAERAKSEMVGMTKASVFACAGIPARQESVGNMEFLSYSGGGDVVTAHSGSGTVVSTNVVVGSGVSTAQRRYCEVTIVLTDGVVTKVNYSGRTGGLLSKGEQCAFVVDNCVTAR
jgi:hypothetical protein